MITTAKAVHDLPAAEAKKKLPVHLRATVTYYEPSQQNLFIADQSGAVYVRVTHVYPVRAGDLVDIEGTTASSYRTIVAANPKIRVVGRGSAPRAAIQTEENYAELMSGRWDCQLATMRGVVRSATPVELDGKQSLELELELKGGMVLVMVQQWRGLDLSTLVDDEVEITGVVGGGFNAKWQLMHIVLYAQSGADLRVLHRPGPEQASSGTLTPIDQVMQTRLVEDRSRRVQVRGVVTYYLPGQSIVIQDGASSISAQTVYDEPLALGSVVVLSGFADPPSYVPSLGEVEVWPTGESAVVRPAASSYAELSSGKHSDDLVDVQGTLLTEQHTNANDMLFLNVDNHTVGVVQTRGQGKAGLPELSVGSRVRVTGVCKVDSRVASGPPEFSQRLFHLELRTPADVVVMAPPSWWTVRHLAMLLGILLVVALGVAGWGFGLQQRVSKQKFAIERVARMERQRATLLEMINTSLPLADLLERICAMVNELAPGLCCWCVLPAGSLHPAELEGGSTDQVRSIGKRAAFTLLNVPLLRRRGTGESAGLAELSSSGVLKVDADQQRSLEPWEFEVFTAAAELAALAVQQRQMYEELEWRSLHDGLTSLANRRCADQHLQSALEQAQQQGGAFMIAFLDINGFKQVNDQHGHKVGDLYLQAIAGRLDRQKRQEDFLARMGGDEFLLVSRLDTCPAPGKAEELSRGYRERLERAFREPFELEGICLRGSASIGVALYPLHGQTEAELHRYADAQMYAVKQAWGTDRSRSRAGSGGAQPLVVAAAAAAVALPAPHGGAF